MIPITECRTAEEVWASARKRFRKPTTPVVRVAQPTPPAQPEPPPQEQEQKPRVRDWLFVAEPTIQCILVEDIIRAVSEYYRVPCLDLLSSRRTANVVRPRQIAMYLAK